MEAYPIKTNKFNGTHLLISKPYQRNSGEMDRQPTKVHVRASTRSNHTSQAINIVSTRRLLLARVNLGVGILYMCPAALAGPQVERNEAEVFRTKKLNSGVRFQDIIEGEGLEAREGDLVEFNYVCRRSNGYFVHSTVDQFSGESNPVVLPLDEKQIIKGLKEVLVGMKVGGKRRASVPPNVGYINEDLKPIPDEFGPRRSLLSHANETLIFEVQLLKVSAIPWCCICGNFTESPNPTGTATTRKALSSRASIKVHNQIVWSWDGPRQFLPENVRRLPSLPTFNADSYGGNLNSSNYFTVTLTPSSSPSFLNN